MLDVVVQRALAEKPGERFASADEMRRMLALTAQASSESRSAVRARPVATLFLRRPRRCRLYRLMNKVLAPRRLRLRAMILLVAPLGACATESGGYVRVDAMNAYRGYDDFQPEKDKAVLAKSATVDVKSAQVRIFQETLPAGVELKEGVFGVAPGYQHRLIGKYAYSPGKAISKVDLVAHVKQLAVAADGDAAIILFQAVDPKDFDKAQGVEAIIVRLDPRTTRGDDRAPPPPPGNKSL